MSKTEKESKIKGTQPKSQFTRFVQIGRVCLINYGPYTGKLCVILDVIDANRALISGPSSGVPRHALNFKRMSLTDFRIRINRGSRNKVVAKALETAKISEKWEQTSLAKKISTRTKRANLNDFERFKVMILKQKRNRVIREATRKLLRGSKKSYSKNKLARYQKFLNKCKEKKQSSKRQKVVEKEPEPKSKTEPKGKGKPETKKPAVKGTGAKREQAPAETQPAAETKPVVETKPTEKKGPAQKQPAEKKPTAAAAQKKGGPAEKKPVAKGTPPAKQEPEPAPEKPAETEKKPTGKQPAKTGGKPAPKTAEKPAEEKTETESKPTEKKAPAQKQPAEKKTTAPKSPPPKQQSEKKPKQ